MLAPPLASPFLALSLLLAPPQGGHEVHLDVRLPDGTPADSAVVLFHHGGDPTSSSQGRWTSADRPVRLFADRGTLLVYVDPVEMVLPGPPGRTNSFLRVDGRMLAPWASLPVELDFTERRDEGPLRVDLARTPHLAIEVRAAGEDERPEVLVAALEMDGVPAHRSPMHRGLGIEVPCHRWRGDVLEVFGLAPGDQRVVHVGVEGRPPLGSVKLAQGRGRTEAVLALRPLLERSVRFRVEGLPPEDGPRDRVQVRRHARAERGGVEDTPPIEDDGEGWQRAFLAPEDSSLARPEWMNGPCQTILSVSRDGFGVIAKEIAFDGRPLEFSFEPPGEVTVRLAGERETTFEYVLSPVGMREVMAATGTSRMERSRLDPVQPGRYLLEVLRPSSRRSRVGTSGLLLHAQEIEVTRGSEQEIDLELPARRDLFVVSESLPAGTTVHVVPAGLPDRIAWRRGAAARLDETGRARFEQVPEGAFVVRAGTWYRPVEIPAGAGRTPDAPLVVSPEGTRTARVRLESTEGPLWEAGFRDGDLVTGIDGVEFDSPEAARSWLSVLRSAPAVLTVLRAGGTLEIELERLGAAADVNSGLLGGWIEPHWPD